VGLADAAFAACLADAPDLDWPSYLTARVPGPVAAPSVGIWSCLTRPIRYS